MRPHRCQVLESGASHWTKINKTHTENLTQAHGSFRHNDICIFYTCWVQYLIILGVISALITQVASHIRSYYWTAGYSEKGDVPSLPWCYFIASEHTNDLFKKRQTECSQLEGLSPFTGRKIITGMVSNILFISLYFGGALYSAVCIWVHSMTSAPPRMESSYRERWVSLVALEKGALSTHNTCLWLRHIY